jgi:hypothetical protein
MEVTWHNSQMMKLAVGLTFKPTCTAKPEKKILTVLSNFCGGQNKNKSMLSY